MRYSEISEAPIADFQYFDSPEVAHPNPRPELNKSRALFQNEKGRAKIYRMFSKTPFVFNFYVMPIRDISRYAPLSKRMSKEELEQLSGIEVETEGKITILYTNNVSNDDRPLNAWMLAHRIGHTLQVKTIDLVKIEALYNRLLNLMISDDRYYEADVQLNGLKPSSSSGILNQEKDIMNKLHTMKSARDGVIGARWDLDGLGELIAQYLIAGKVKLNRLEGFEEEIAGVEQEINSAIEDILRDMVGKIWNF